MLTQRNQRGVSLIELSVTIAIAALLITLAVPSFKIMLANAQIRTAAQGLHDGLQLARVEAIRRNQRVRFTKDTGSTWTVAAINADNTSTTLQSKPSTEGAASATVTVTPNGAAMVTFSALGRITANTDATASITQLDIDVPTTMIAAADSKNSRIVITTGGAIRICDPNGIAGVGAGC